MSNVLGTFAQPLTAGVIAGVGSMVIAPELTAINLPLINREIPTSLAVGVVTAVSAGISAGVANYVVPMFENPRYAAFAADALPPIGTGVVTYATVRFGDSGAGGQAFTAAKVGVLSTTAHYLANNVREVLSAPANGAT